VDVQGAGTSVLMFGNVRATGSGAYGISCSRADIQISGDIFSEGLCILAKDQANVEVNGHITTGSQGSYGIYSTNGSTVTAEGTVAAHVRGVFAEGGSIIMTGDVTADAGDGAYAVNLTSPSLVPGLVRIRGNVSGVRYGIESAYGGSVTVTGDVVSRTGSTSYHSAAVYAKDTDSVCVVHGNVLANGINSSGVEVYAGGSAQIFGDVTAWTDDSYGVSSLSGMSGGTLRGGLAVIDGIVTAQSYILVGSTLKAVADNTEPSLRAGYKMYQGGADLCLVYVKETEAPTVPDPPVNPDPGVVTTPVIPPVMQPEVPEVLPETPAKPVIYQVIRGVKAKWYLRSQRNLSFTCETKAKGLLEVLIDGKKISAKKYVIAAKGHTIRLKPLYLRSLTVGKHTIRLVYTAGYAQTTFTIRRSGYSGK